MSTKDLIDAIQSGDSQAVEQSFQVEMASRISARLDDMRKDIAKSMFTESFEEEDLTLEDYSIEDLEEYMMSEEFEQLDELSGATLGAYVQKARSDRSARYAHANELDSHEKVKPLQAKLSALYNKKEYTRNGDNKNRKSIDATYDKIDSTKKKIDPNYPNSVITSHRNKGIDRAIRKLTTGKMTEELVLELSRATLASYTKKAANDMADKQTSAQDNYTRGIQTQLTGLGDQEMRNHFAKNSLDKSKVDMDSAIKRRRGISKALSKLAKEEFSLDLDEETLDELSKDTLSSYIKKATHSAIVSGEAGGAASVSGKPSYNHYKKAMKRQVGINKAADTLAK